MTCYTDTSSPDDRHAADRRPTCCRQTTDMLPTDDRHAADSRPLGSDRYVDRVIAASIDRHSMECLRKVGFYSPTIDRHIDRVSIDRSIKCQPHTIDMSVECRSLVSIDTRPRVPLVHMMQNFYALGSRSKCDISFAFVEQD